MKRKTSGKRDTGKTVEDLLREVLSELKALRAEMNENFNALRASLKGLGSKVRTPLQPDDALEARISKREARVARKKRRA